MENNIYEGTEKRSFFRIVYNPSKRPELKTNGISYKVIDISQKGIRLLKSHESGPAKRIQGNLKLLSGSNINLKGTVVWEQDNRFALFLEDPLSPETLEKERQYVILH